MKTTTTTTTTFGRPPSFPSTVVAAAAGMLLLLGSFSSMTTCRGQQAVVPTSTPAPAPAPFAKCSSELEAWMGCVRDAYPDDSFGTYTDACKGCVESFGFLVSDGTPCQELTATACQTIEFCSSSVCGGDADPCLSVIEAYEKCYWGSDCFGTCAETSEPTAGPTTTPPPSFATAEPTVRTAEDDAPPSSSSSSCAAENEDLLGCVGLIMSSDATTECIRCYGAYGAAHYTTTPLTCEEHTLYWCRIPLECPVCQCQPYTQALSNCKNRNVPCYPVDCSSLTDSTTADDADGGNAGGSSSNSNGNGNGSDGNNSPAAPASGAVAPEPTSGGTRRQRQLAATAAAAAAATAAAAVWAGGDASATAIGLW
jgi:hypothetical protein